MLSKHCPHPFHQAHTPGGLRKGGGGTVVSALFYLFYHRLGGRGRYPSHAHWRICVYSFSFFIYSLCVILTPQRDTHFTQIRVRSCIPFFFSNTLFYLTPQRDTHFTQTRAHLCFLCFFICSLFVFTSQRDLQRYPFHTDARVHVLQRVSISARRGSVCARHMHTLFCLPPLHTPSLPFFFLTHLSLYARC